MPEKIIVSKNKSIEWRDFLKGLVVAVLTSILVVIQSTIEQGSLKFNWQQIGMVAVGSVIAYLTKNFFAPASVTTTYSNNKVAERVGQDIKDENK